MTLSNVERLKAKLAENGLRIGGVSWNESFRGAPEERAAALLTVIESLENGDFEEVEPADDYPPMKLGSGAASTT